MRKTRSRIRLDIIPLILANPVTTEELRDYYSASCSRHNAKPLDVVLEHLDALEVDGNARAPLLDLHETTLTHEDCESLEEVFKRVSQRLNFSPRDNFLYLHGSTY